MMKIDKNILFMLIGGSWPNFKRTLGVIYLVCRREIMCESFISIYSQLIIMQIYDTLTTLIEHRLILTCISTKLHIRKVDHYD